jgi:hypothetical protein
MFALVKNDDSIKLFSPYTIWEDKNGIQYSPDYLLSLSIDQKQNLGIYDVAYATRPDDRFYTVSENAPTFDQQEKIVKITYTSTAKSLDDTTHEELPVLGLKSQYIAQVRDTANKTLAQTDWTLVRKIERNIDVPSDIATARANIVADAEAKVAAITAVTKIEDLIALVG